MLVLLVVGATAAAHAAGLVYTAPATWVAHATRSSMRVGQWALPRAAPVTPTTPS